MNSIVTKILIGVILVIAVLGVRFYRQTIELKRKISDQVINIKSLEQGITQYKDKFGTVYTRIIDQRKTIDEIKFSKDTTIINLKEKLVAANIALKDVTRIGEVETQIVKETRIKYVPRDTTYDLSEPPYLYETIAIAGDSLTRKLDIRDKVTSVTSLKRETVEPRKKFFLARWFQRRHNVAYTTIFHANPLIKDTSSTQITILNKDGSPKE